MHSGQGESGSTGQEVLEVGAGRAGRDAHAGGGERRLFIGWGSTCLALRGGWSLGVEAFTG